ncbi:MULTISPECIES: DUF1294 domain-containing protein [Novosphingobium]|jgi:uncharacterized membrane protein YsdA (DUF1294 family)|uniref:Putative inner membrane protein n=1 Tax=Novosphingobium pentaromativorans US6-1 TaxID=1088721 RepID=G6E9Z7_9SPHN|nr:MULTISPECIES: DUF1294 domain-containing protein [Novosphingobium]AIT80858.1 cold-shock protein [Novosphingobium pentaromativorans US6-1]EHJ61854.1 putative inner membrane protein [Novosphingobium pentaromativorans US6-1]GFM28512.1 putative inner membrane protein [Novosphingobium sp. PY1]
MEWIVAGAAWLLLINFVTFASFGFDKVRARKGGRRVPEFDLLLMALLGGSPAAFAARWAFRHKTRKQPFSWRLSVIAALQVGALIGLVFAQAPFLPA